MLEVLSCRTCCTASVPGRAKALTTTHRDLTRRKARKTYVKNAEVVFSNTHTHVLTRKDSFICLLFEDLTITPLSNYQLWHLVGNVCTVYIAPRALWRSAKSSTILSVGDMCPLSSISSNYHCSLSCCQSHANTWTMSFPVSLFTHVASFDIPWCVYTWVKFWPTFWDGRYQCLIMVVAPYLYGRYSSLSITIKFKTKALPCTRHMYNNLR